MGSDSSGFRSGSEESEPYCAFGLPKPAMRHHILCNMKQMHFRYGKLPTIISYLTDMPCGSCAGLPCRYCIYDVLEMVFYKMVRIYIPHFAGGIYTCKYMGGFWSLPGYVSIPSLSHNGNCAVDSCRDCCGIVCSVSEMQTAGAVRALASRCIVCSVGVCIAYGGCGFVPEWLYGTVVCFSSSFIVYFRMRHILPKNVLNSSLWSLSRMRHICRTWCSRHRRCSAQCCSNQSMNPISLYRQNRAEWLRRHTGRARGPNNTMSYLLRETPVPGSARRSCIGRFHRRIRNGCLASLLAYRHMQRFEFGGHPVAYTPKCGFASGPVVYDHPVSCRMVC